jgi:7-carboxy-7-deazaguanine synthase
MFKAPVIAKNVTSNFLDVQYPIMEHFYTIQGEGYHTGVPAYFIRTAGCDVQCWWCDVKDSWDGEKHPLISVKYLCEQVKNSGTGKVVITGGEPLLHDLHPLTTELKKLAVDVHIETSGSSSLSGSLDWVTLSPKRFKKPLMEVYEHVDELKVVVLTNKDIEWAESEAQKCPTTTRLYLQPEWDTAESIPLIVNYVKKNPQWAISLQTHKFLDVP